MGDLEPRLTEFPERLAVAIRLYQSGQISQEKAAQVADLDRTDFLMALAREGVDSFVVDFDDLQREVGLAEQD